MNKIMVHLLIKFNYGHLVYVIKILINAVNQVEYVLINI